MTQRVFLIAAAILALATAGSWVVQADQAQSPAFSLAFVDLHRISNEYDGTKQRQTELDTFQQSLKKQLDDREAVRFLDDKELADATALRAKASLTPDETKTLSDLLATSKSRGDQLRALQQNPNKTDAEKADFTRLTALSDKTDTDIDKLGTSLQDQLTARGEELSKQLTDTVSAAISVVAKQKGYSTALDKQAVLYGGADITDDVLKQLKK